MRACAGSILPFENLPLSVSFPLLFFPKMRISPAD